MIAQLRGSVSARGSSPSGDAAQVVVDVGGVGYLVVVPAGLAGRLPGPGGDVELHTSLQVREDSMTLYGFPTAEARDLFEALLTASGVGPKLALAALSTLAPDALRRAVGGGDVDALMVVPGIGRKSAQRLVLELRDKLGPGGQADVVTVAAAGATALGEVRLALLELGYSAAEAQRAVEPLLDDGDVGELLRAALRSLAGAGQ
ncbi:MAG: Holliday junction branch migration protein RuvA [Actinobacteria bacterium]|nr:Holliday junction branch migration protein RuvA [Actinomycetota bacterium]